MNDAIRSKRAAIQAIQTEAQALATIATPSSLDTDAMRNALYLPMDEETRGQLAQLQREPLHCVVNALVEKEGMQRIKAQVTAAEYRKFMALCILGGRNETAAPLWGPGARPALGMPSELVDLAWHHHILATREYAAFCQRVCGEFIHHEPAENGDLDENASLVDPLQAYRMVFGEPPSIWQPPPNKCIRPAKCNRPYNRV